MPWLQALAHLPEDGDTGVLSIELRLALDGPLLALGENGRRLALLGEAEALARALDDQARLGRVLAQMAGALRMAGDLDGAIAVGQQALALAVALGESALQVQAAYILGRVYQVIGDSGRAVELLQWSVEAADRAPGTPSTDIRIGSRAWLARTLSALGAFTEGRRHGEAVLRLATLEGRGITPIIAHGCLGLLSLAQGDLEHAIQVLDQGLALCRASGNREQALALAEALGMHPLMAHCHHGLGQLYGQTGHAEQARTELATAIDLYRAMDMTFWLPQAEAALAQTGGAEGPEGGIP